MQRRLTQVRLRIRAVGLHARRQSVWSIAAGTGMAVLILMLVLQLLPMLAAHRTRSAVPPNANTVFLPLIDADGRNGGQKKSAPLLDVTLLRLSPQDSENTQSQEATFTASVSTTDRVDGDNQRRKSPGTFLESAQRVDPPFPELDVLEQGADDDHWQRYDSRRRSNLTRPLLIRHNPIGAINDQRDALEREVFRRSTKLTATAVTRVTAPNLQIVVTAPDRLFIGDRCPIQFRTTNTGDAPATGVRVRIRIPSAFVYPKGKSLEYIVGTIPAGESRDARLTPRAISTGTATFTVELEQNGHVVKQSVTSVRVEMPDESQTTPPTQHTNKHNKTRVPRQSKTPSAAFCPCPLSP